MEIIQCIQSFLDGKEAARTTIFSKSWYEAWLTRPNLDFSQLDFEDDEAFLNFGTKTMQRYEESNRNILSLKLRIDGCWSPDKISLTMEWTKKAIKLGVADLHILIYTYNFVLPREVLESETLVRLSLSGICKIDLRNQKVSCSRLKSLHLLGVLIEGNSNIWDLISTCPLIEELLISSGRCELVFNSGLGKNIFHKLKVLSLENVETGDLFFHDLSSKFPCLKELIFRPITSHRDIQIYSNSLESVECKSFHDYEVTWSAKFDVPRIKKFKFFGYGLPSLSFKTTSTEWESDISIKWTREISCFAELRKILHELSPSKIYLNLVIRGWDEYGDFICLPKPPTVEKLTIQISLFSAVHSAVLEDLFWICRPNFLVLEFRPYSMSGPLYTNTSGLMKLLCNIPIEEGKENRNMSDLEEVKFDFFRRKYGGEWLPLACKTLIEASTFSEGRLSIIVCLQLKWGKSF